MYQINPAGQLNTFYMFKVMVIHSADLQSDNAVHNRITYSRQLNASHTSSAQIKNTGSLNDTYIRFVNIKDSSQFNTVDTERISSYQINRNLGHNLPAQGTMRAQPRSKGCLYRRISKETAQI